MTEGVGRTRQWGGPLEDIRAGDVVWCPPGGEHGHGAAPDSVMAYARFPHGLNGISTSMAVPELSGG